MAGTTTYYGISYPTSTDYVKDGATAMQTIADGFDSAVAIPTYNNQTGTSYTFVLTDAGKTVTSNNASAVTFTIPPQASVAWANNTTLTVRNLGAGVVTIAGGAGVTVTNTAQTVAQYGEVKIIRTASNAWTVVPASGGASGLTLITTATFSGQTSVSVNDCFSSTYVNYLILWNISSAVDSDLGFYYRASGSNFTNNYVQGNFYIGYSTGSYNNYGSSSTTYQIVGGLSSAGAAGTILINNPNQTGRKHQQFNCSGLAYYSGAGYNTTATAATGFNIFQTSATTITGNIRVYGYANS